MTKPSSRGVEIEVLVDLYLSSVTSKSSLLMLRRWRNRWWRFQNGKFMPIAKREVRSDIRATISREYQGGVPSAVYKLIEHRCYAPSTVDLDNWL